MAAVRPEFRTDDLVFGIDQPEATISFAKVPQPWLRELAKRYARWQLATGLSASTAGTGTWAVTRFAGFLAAQPAPSGSLAGMDRPLLERYLAVLRAEMGGRVCHVQYIGALNSFLRAIRQHGWDDALPASAAMFPEDFPDRGPRLPRALAAHVMAQVEQPGNLARQDNPACRLITLILIRCGLRVSSAAGLAFDCVITDSDRPDACNSARNGLTGSTAAPAASASRHGTNTPPVSCTDPVSGTTSAARSRGASPSEITVRDRSRQATLQLAQARKINPKFGQQGTRSGCCSPSPASRPASSHTSWTSTISTRR